MNHRINKFINSVIHTSAGYMIQMILGFIGLIYAVRYVPKSDIGLFVLIQLIAFLFISFSSLILEDMSVTKYISVDEEKHEIAAIALSFKILILIIFSFLSIIAKPFVFMFYNGNGLSELYIYIPVLIFLGGLEAHLFRIFQGYQIFTIMAVSQIVSGVLRLAIVLLFVVSLGYGVKALLNSFIFSYAISIGIQYFFLPMKKKFKFNYKKVKEISRFGFPLGINKLLDFIFTKIDRFMIGAMIGTIGVASYEIATKIPEIMSRLFESFRYVFFPNMSKSFSEKNYTESQNVLNHSIRLITFATVLASLLVTFFQRDIILFLFSATYIESANALSFLMISVSISFVGNLIGTTLVALGQSDKPAKINTVNAFFNIIGNLILIPIFGIMGAVYATLISTCITNPVNVYYLNKTNLKISVTNYAYPFIFYFTYILMRSFFPIENILFKFFIIISFILLCFFKSIIKMSDFAVLVNFIAKKELLNVK